MDGDEQLTARLIEVLLEYNYLTAKQIAALAKASNPSLLRKIIGNKTVQKVVGVAAAVGALLLHPPTT